MKRVSVALCALLSVSALLAVPQLFSQEAKTAPKAEVKKEGKKESKGRLPNNYGKLELTEQQVTTIYGIQAKYGPEIDQLEAQLAALKAKQTTEVKAVLTTAQTTKLAEIEAAAKKKPDPKKTEPAKADATKTEPAKTEAPKKVEPKPTVK